MKIVRCDYPNTFIFEYDGNKNDAAPHKKLGFTFGATNYTITHVVKGLQLPEYRSYFVSAKLAAADERERYFVNCTLLLCWIRKYLFYADKHDVNNRRHRAK
jgi:hypothetical protein